MSTTPAAAASPVVSNSSASASSVVGNSSSVAPSQSLYLTDKGVRMILGTEQAKNYDEFRGNPLLKPFFEKKHLDELSIEELTNLVTYAKTSVFFEKEFDTTFLKCIDDFIIGTRLIAETLNQRFRGEELVVLVPGDSGAKICKYIQIMKLCPNCRFIEFPFSRSVIEAKNKDKPEFNRFWKDLDIILPNIDLDNLILLDISVTGQSLITMLTLVYKRRIDEGKINKKNNAKFEEIRKELIENRDLYENYFEKNLPLPRIPEVRNIVNILFYFKETKCLEKNIIHAEGSNTRCQPLIDVDTLHKGERLFDQFGCDFFVYMACVFTRYRAEIEGIIGTGIKPSVLKLYSTDDINTILGVGGGAGISQADAFRILSEKIGPDWKKRLDPAAKLYVGTLGGGYYDKYMKYKAKYIALKSNML